MHYQVSISPQLVRSVSSKTQISNQGYLSQSQLFQCLDSMDVFRKMFEQITWSSRKQLLNKIMKIVKYKQLDQNEIIYQRGELTRDIYLVVWGSVGAYINTNNSIQEIRIFRQGHGFGEAEAITHGRRIFEARTKQYSCLGIIKPEDFQQFLQKYKEKVYLCKLIKLSQHYLFKKFKKYQLEVIVHNTKQIHLVKNQTIYCQNQESQYIYLIDKGEVKMTKQFNNKQLQICIIYQGQLIGEVQVILNKNREYTTISNSENLLLYEINKKVFFSQINDFILQEITISIQEKDATRKKRFIKYSLTRIKTEQNRSIINNEDNIKYLSKNIKRHNVRSSTISDENHQIPSDVVDFGEKFIKNVDYIIKRKKNLLEKNYGISINKKMPIKNYKFFDYQKQIRPRILHTKSRRMELLTLQKQKSTEKVDQKDHKQSNEKIQLKQNLEVQVQDIQKMTEIQQNSLQIKEGFLKLPIIKFSRPDLNKSLK